MMIFFSIQFNLHLQRSALKDPYWLTLFNHWGLFSHRCLLISPRCISRASTSVQLLTSWCFFWWPRNWGLQPLIRQISGSDLPLDRLLGQNLAHSMLNVTFVPFRLWWQRFVCWRQFSSRVLSRAGRRRGRCVKSNANQRQLRGRCGDRWKRPLSHLSAPILHQQTERRRPRPSRWLFPWSQRVFDQGLLRDSFCRRLLCLGEQMENWFLADRNWEVP